MTATETGIYILSLSLSLPICVLSPNAAVNTGRTGAELTGGRNLQTRYFMRTRPVQPVGVSLS